MNTDVFNNISKIIERDSKATTYKYALLRGVIDIIQENSPYITFTDKLVNFPIGLLIEKWLMYYYPIINSQPIIPQINGSSKLAFSKHFHIIVTEYEKRGGFSAFYNDLRNKGIPKDLNRDFFELSKSLRDTITKMPMKYIGRSINNNYYSIFDYKIQRLGGYSHFDTEVLINEYGTFSIPFDYYEAFRILGSFINGQDSILFKWAEFSINASGKTLTIENVLNKVLEGPITDRNIIESKKLYRKILEKKGKVYCVWTGKKIPKYEIDHLIPFSIWKNNDLWNLLPSEPKINNQKRDKIPTPNLIEQQKGIIIDYWEFIFESQQVRFQKEIQVALLGSQSFEKWKTYGITQLQKSCNYLIENRGFEGWEI
jgi:hypothetical protein